MALPPASLIGGVYQVDFTAVLDNAAPPGPAYGATAAGGQRGFMAIQVARGWPARAKVLSTLSGQAIQNLLTPLAHGTAVTPGGDTGYFIVCPSPPGPSLAANLRVWGEAELLEHVLKPATLILGELQTRGVTHRAIRPDNLFQPAPGTPVTFGAAWAAPPACHQPHWLEPPHSASCLPAGRGDGTTADDIYALGAVLLTLALGRNPVEGMAADDLLHRKLDVGSFTALVGNHRLPGAIAELLRGMLADDPDHRPTPALLRNPTAARARRIAARPIRRAQRPIEIGRWAAGTVRTLAFALQREPTAGVAALRNGLVDRWLRRSLGDIVAAGLVDEAVRMRDAQSASGDTKADASLITHAIAALDAAAPLVWRSFALWPNGLGAALDHAMHHAPAQAATIAEIATLGIAELWERLREAPADGTLDRMAIGESRTKLKSEGNNPVPFRLTYLLNPLAPCESPLLRRFWVARLADLLPALEAAMATRLPDGQPLIDGHAAAFITVRRDERLQADIGQLAAAVATDDVLSQLRLVARLQAKTHPDVLRHLCAWAADSLQPEIQSYRSKSRRTRIAKTLAGLAEGGQLTPIAELLGDERERTLDAQEYASAESRMAGLQDTFIALGQAEPLHDGRARRAGHDIGTGLAALVCLAALGLAAFG